MEFYKNLHRHFDNDMIYVGIVLHQFAQIYNRVMALDSCQNFISAQYLKNKSMEFYKILHIH